MNRRIKETLSRKEVEVTGEVFAELGLPLPSSRDGALFLRGPIPLKWLARVDTGPHTMATALALVVAADLGRDLSSASPRAIWQQLGLSSRTRRRALNTLERAGIVKVERSPGRAARYLLLVKPRRRCR